MSKVDEEYIKQLLALINALADSHKVQNTAIELLHRRICKLEKKSND